MKYTVGIIGNGRFGDMLFKTFSRYGWVGGTQFEVKMYDKNEKIKNQKTKKQKNEKQKFFSLEEVCRCDIVIPAVPISAFESVIKQIKDLVDDSSLIVDVCSVSVHPAEVMQQNLGCDLLSTHPMFGPDSTKDATFFKDLKFIFHPIRSENQKRIDDFLAFWEGLGCDMRHLTPDEHDKQAAYTHAFAFLIGKIGIDLGVRRNDISTKGFEGVLYNQEAVENDTGQLFQDMMTFNPYAKEMREKVKKSLDIIENELIG